jgi:hypothetical protein
MRLFYFLLFKGRLAGQICALLLCIGFMPAFSQTGNGIVVNLAPLDGVVLTPENIFSFGIQSNIAAPTDVIVKGTLHYRQSTLSFSYTFPTTIRQGMNNIDAAAVNPKWEFSGQAFRELFRDYHILPQGTYEYCVSVTASSASGDAQGGEQAQECLYQKADDIFLINLVDPENDAKIYEHYPVFSWIVNYPFASQLTYRIRVAEIKAGQNTANAITRNNPVYTESNLPQTTTTYPVYGKPLITFQPYAWTVDAYYKGILLGGAEPWKFTIVEDSLLEPIPRDVSDLDIKQENGGSQFYAIGKLKIKYLLEDLKKDSLKLRLFNEQGEIKLKADFLIAQQGDNRFEIDFYNNLSLRHLKPYTLEISSETRHKYIIQFKYVNPDFLK